MVWDAKEWQCFMSIVLDAFRKSIEEAPKIDRMSSELSAVVNQSEDADWRNFGCFDEHPSALHAVTAAMMNLGGGNNGGGNGGSSGGAGGGAGGGAAAATAAAAGHGHGHHGPLHTDHSGMSVIYESGYSGYTKGLANAGLPNHPTTPPTPSGSTSPAVVKKEPEDLTHRRSQCPSTSTAPESGQHQHQQTHQHQHQQQLKVHSSVISRALANGELVVSALDSIGSLGHSGHAMNNAAAGGEGDSGGATSPVLLMRRPLPSVNEADTLVEMHQQQQEQQHHHHHHHHHQQQQQQQQQQQPQHYSSASGQSFASTTGLTPIQVVHEYEPPSSDYSVSVLSPAAASRFVLSHGAIRHVTNSGSVVYATDGSGSTGNASDYYREFFANGPSADQFNGGTTSRPTPASLIYVGGGDPHVIDGPTNFERCAIIRTGGGGVYKQQGTPDSGIGNDAITPRDQSVVQQVSSALILYQPPTLSRKVGPL